MAIIQGFRPAIKNQVIRKGVTNMYESIRAAKLAESMEVTIGDSIRSSLLEMMKASITASGKQAH